MLEIPFLGHYYRRAEGSCTYSFGRPNISIIWTTAYHPTPDSLSYACYQALERQTAISANLAHREQERDVMLSEDFYKEFTI